MELRKLDLGPTQPVVDSKICLLGMINGDGYTTHDAGIIYLLPTNPKHSNVLFYPFTPPRDALPSEGVDQMRIEELECDVAWLYDGTLLSRYDGDAMRLLFDEGN
jgi:hypothetical protein